MGIVMFCIQEAFVQVTFSVTRLESRILIHPLAPSLSAPNGESWKSVSDQIMSRVPSTILLEMLVKELNRELKAIGLENINGWVFHSQRTLEVSQLLERYHLRFVALTNGVIADEISNALDHLFSQDPRFQARLSDWDDRKEAVADVTRRVIAQLRFLWQIERLMISDTSALGLRLLIELQDVLYRRLNESCLLYTSPSPRDA